MQLDFTWSEPTSRRLSAGNASCFMVCKPSSRALSAQEYRRLIRLRTNYRGVRVGCSLLICFLNLPLGNCLPGWSLCNTGLNLSPGNCWQLDFTCSKPTSRGLSAGGTYCFYSLNPPLGTLGHGYSLFIQFPSLTLRGCLFDAPVIFLFHLVHVLSLVYKSSEDLSLSLSLSLSLAEYILSGEAQTRCQSISRPQLMEPT